MIGPLGSSHGTGRLRLEPTDDGTRVTYDYEIHLAGKVAAVGGRMLQGAARVLIGQFFAGLIGQCVGDTERTSRGPRPSAGGRGFSGHWGSCAVKPAAFDYLAPDTVEEAVVARSPSTATTLASWPAASR